MTESNEHNQFVDVLEIMFANNHLRQQRDHLQRDNTRFEAIARAAKAQSKSLYKELVAANLQVCQHVLEHAFPSEVDVEELTFADIRDFQGRGRRWIGWLTGYLKEISP